MAVPSLGPHSYLRDNGGNVSSHNADAETGRARLERELRASYGGLVAALLRRFGTANLSLVEQAAQSTCLLAREQWLAEGAPAERMAWLLRAACNHVSDALESRHERSSPLQVSVEDELCLMFWCCHPLLSEPSRTALSLNAVYGFAPSTLALALATDERVVQHRVERAKHRLRAQGARYELPTPDEMPERLGAVLEVLHQVFEAAHSPTDGETVIDDTACATTLRLARLLAETPETSTPLSQALYALLCFYMARFPARRAADGSVLLLHEQDRARWDAELLQHGRQALERARQGNVSSRYHIEAAIAACHAAAATHSQTEWSTVVELYDSLCAMVPSPLVDVDRAVAIFMAEGAAAGLKALDAIIERGLIEHYPYALIVYAELHASLGEPSVAARYLDMALSHRHSPAERALLLRRRAALVVGFDFDYERCVELCRQQGLSLGGRIVYHRVTDSTNDDALVLVKEGAPHGVVVIADEQRRGRGRRGNSWSCASGEGLTFSVVLRGSWPKSQLSVLPLVVGLAVREVVARHVSRACQVKWPNDVLVGGRKLCGVLLEAHVQGGVTEAVVVGVGLNVLTRRFPEELAGVATSLALLGATLLEREALLVELLAAFERRTRELFERGFHEQWLELCQCDALRNKRVRVDEVEGTALGIAENGGLILRSAGGDQVLLAGTVVVLGDA